MKLKVVKPRPAVEDGAYVAKFAEYRERPGMRYGDAVELDFKILKGEYKGQRLRGLINLEVQPGTKGARWLAALGVDDDDLQAGSSVDLDELIGNKVRLIVYTEETAKGTFSRIKSVRPVKGESEDEEDEKQEEERDEEEDDEDEKPKKSRSGDEEEEEKEDEEEDEEKPRKKAESDEEDEESDDEEDEKPKKRGRDDDDEDEKEEEDEDDEKPKKGKKDNDEDDEDEEEKPKKGKKSSDEDEIPF